MKYVPWKPFYTLLRAPIISIPLYCTVAILLLFSSVHAAEGDAATRSSSLGHTARPLRAMDAPRQREATLLQAGAPITDVVASVPPTTTVVGDLIWFDADNDGSFDAGEQGLNNVTIALYPAGASVSSSPFMVTTSSVIDGRDGRYLFSKVPPGAYFIHIPASQFQPEGPLAGFISTIPTEADPGDDEDEDGPGGPGSQSGPGDDNGINDPQPAQNGISSGVFQLVLGEEPTEENSGAIKAEWDAYTNLTVDFGFFQPLKIGDMVWLDNNANGIYEPQAGEIGAAGIGVELYTPQQSTPLAVVQTDQDGRYLFSDLEPDQYYIRFITTTLPANHQITQRDQGQDQTLDSDVDPATGWVYNENVLLSGQEHMDWDMGIFPLVSVGGRVWADLNANGLRDIGSEDNEGIQGITVALFYAATNQPVPSPTNPPRPLTVTTDEGGRYLFSNLLPGNYYVVFDPASFPPDYVITTQHAGAELLDAPNNSDADPATGRTNPTGFLEGAETSLLLDMGLHSLVTVGGSVWLDANRNGLRQPLGADTVRDTDDDEPGVAAVKVRIYKEGAPFVAVAETQTDANGDYVFAQLPPHSYVVEFDRTTFPAGHQITLQNAAANEPQNDQVDSDAEISSGLTDPTGLLTPGQRQLHMDLGIWTPVSVAGQVWYDLNNDGIQSARELLGVADVKVALYAATANGDPLNQAPLSSTTTNTRGQYAFNDRPPGDYVVRFDPATLPENYHFTAQDIGGISGFYDSDVDPVSGQSGNTGFLFSGQSRRSIDAGVWLPTAVSGRVWFDNNGNGLQEEGEGGVANVAVTIFAEGEIIPFATQRTSASGAYRFENLPPASYYLLFDPATLPGGYGITTPNATNGVPANTNPDTIDSDINPSSGYSSSTGQLHSGFQFVRLDMGLRTLNGVRIGDVVWHDRNANGRRESDELGLANVQVELYRNQAPNQVVATMQTDEGGNYLFEQIPPGDYFVRLDPASFPAGYRLSEPQPGGSQADPQTGRTPATGNLAANAQKLDLDAALFKPAELGGTAWVDANGNGLQESGEPGLANVAVELFYADGRATGNTATTGPSGGYLFTELLPSAYSVQFKLPTDYRFSPTDALIVSRLQDENALLSDEIDSDADANGRTKTFAVTSAQRDLSWDMGAYIPLHISDAVWFDANNNGRREPTESGFGGVVVQLVDVNNRLVASTTTAADGAYLFGDLPAGTYSVLLPAANFAPGAPLFRYLSSVGYASSLAERTLSIEQASIDLGVDSLNPAETGIRSVPIRLQSSQVDLESAKAAGVEATVPEPGAAPLGLYTPLSIGNRLWHDQNNNGQLDEAEVGVDGVLLNLYRDENSDGQPDGAILRQQTSAHNGYYLFDNLGAGQYVIQFPASNFQADGVLAGMASSAPTLSEWVETMPLTQTVWVDALDSHDDGRNTYTPWLNGVRSGTIKLEATKQPLAETDQISTTNSIVTDENNNLTVDFGFYKPLSLSSRIWLDLDNNSQISDQETGIENVLLRLYLDTDQNGEPEGEPIAQTVTGVDGHYRFWGLLPGGYLVEVASQNFADSGQLNRFYVSGTESPVPPNSSVRSVPVWLTEESFSIQGISGNPVWQSINSLNSLHMLEMGFYQAVKVGGRIWQDGNANGVQDVDETGGLANIAVTLQTVDEQTGQATPLGVTKTDAAGRYQFDQLVPNEYAVVFDLEAVAQAGHVPSRPHVAGIDGEQNSDADVNTGWTAPTPFLPSGSEETGLDMGVYIPASLGDMVWLDTNINGIYEPAKDERGVAGVRVLLYAAGSNVPLDDPNNPGSPMSSTTDINGRYQFSGLLPGDYVVQFDLSTLPTGYLVSPLKQSSDNAIDSDADRQTGFTAVVTLDAGNTLNSGLDMGVYSPISVGDLVWFDDNANGIQDPGEGGVPGVVATLYSTSTNGPVADPNIPGLPLRTTTAANGRYLFSNVSSDGYYVQFDLATLPAGYRVSVQHGAGSNSIDSDADVVSGQTSPTGRLEAGDAWLSLDMGIWAPASVGDRVWFDLNANGLQDAGEPGVANVLVHLLDEQRQPTGQSVRTDVNGRYLFDNLPLGRYAIHFDLSSLPVGHLPTLQNAGSNATRNSDADRSTGQTPLTPFLTSGQAVWDLDMGVVGVVSVGNRVWLDGNRNGIQDPEEEGVAGVKVTLYQADGSQAVDVFGRAAPPTITDEQGTYLFTNLAPGAYFVQFDLATLPPNHVISAINIGANDALDSDASPSNGQSSLTSFLPGGFSDLTLDMGIHLPIGVRIGDFVWEDLDADGMQDWGEPGVAGIAVKLYVIDAQGEGVFTGQSTNTDAAGSYLFAELPPGQYYVEFVLDTLPVGYRVTARNASKNDENSGNQSAYLDSDADPITGRTAATAAITSNGQNMSLDMGIYKTAELGGRAWLDSDADGSQDIGEFGLRDLRVTLLDASGNATDRTMLTVLDGRYLITDLAPGDYYVQFELPEDYTFSTPNQGRDRANDSDAAPQTGRTPRIHLQSGQSDVTWSAGLHKGAGVGNYIWYDGNANGLQEEDELSIFGVTVQLYNSAGDLLSTATSDGSGLYGFSELKPGEYYVMVAPPNGFVLTHALRGNDAAIDSNIDPKTKRSNVFSLQAGKGNPTIDAGLTLAASIGNFVWYDRNANGYKDVKEDGVGGIEVILYDENGEAPSVVASVLTDANGFYEFTGLLPGRYSLQFVRPATFQFTEQDRSNLGRLTSKADTLTGRTAVTVLEPAENDTIWGAGLVAGPGSVSLVSFRATLQQGGTGPEIDVAWETSAELDTFGFHIYLGTDKTFGSARQMTSQIILGKGNDGGLYHFTTPYDPQNDPPLDSLSVWLAETEIDGSTNHYGPVRVIDPASLKKANYLPIVLR